MPTASQNNVLDLWAIGCSAGAIEMLLGVSRNSVIGTVFRARKRGDKRAVQRAPGWDGSRPEGLSPAIETVRSIRKRKRELW